MSKWVSGQQLLKDFGIRNIELFNDYVRKGLQLYNDLGEPISPLYVVEKLTNITWLIEQYHEKRHSEAELGDNDLKKFDATLGHDLTAQIEHYTKWVHSVKDLDWNKFELPETEAEAGAVLTELVGSLYHIDDINKFLGVPEFEIEKKEIIPELPKQRKLDPRQKAKLKCQEIAKRIWKEEKLQGEQYSTITKMIDHPEIIEASTKKDGSTYLEKTVRDWINKVHPGPKLKGRPKKQKK